MRRPDMETPVDRPTPELATAYPGDGRRLPAMEVQLRR